MTEKVKGSVKWFSNKKGYGFITPVEGSPITDDIFVHQSAIHSEGYRTLDEEWQVEFEIGHDDDGKPKAENVTAPGGGPCFGPRKPRNTSNRRRHRPPKSYPDGDGTDDGTTPTTDQNGSAAAGPSSGSNKEPQPMWHDILDEDVKEALTTKEIRTSTGTIDVSFGMTRIKLGTRSYASMATEDKILAEGTFHCDADGTATFEWDPRAIQFTDVWNSYLDLKSLVDKIELKDDDSVQAVVLDETMHTLMGEDTSDPKSTLIASGFEMRRVVLTTKRR